MVIEDFIQKIEVSLANIEDATKTNRIELISKELQKIKNASETFMIVDIAYIVDEIEVSLMDKNEKKYLNLLYKLEKIVEEMCEVECCYV